PKALTVILLSMQPITVHKIGGSTLKTPQQLNNLLPSIGKNTGKKIIVVSALFGITDSIITALESKEEHTEILKNLYYTHLKWCLYIEDTRLRKRAIVKIRKAIAKLNADINNYRTQPTPHLFAEIVSMGERLSAIVIGGFIGKNQIVLLPEDLELTCTDNYANAKYTTLPGKCRDVIESTTEEWQVVPGFYGINSRGEKCLVGRGGTDYTAAEIAANANAKKLLFWKDSLGIQTGDPRLITKATNIENISVKTLQLMSIAGSGVLHNEVVSCVVRAGINVEFWSPSNINHALSTIRNDCATPQKPIIIVAKEDNKTDQWQKITIISRNITAALIIISQLRCNYPIIKTELLESHAVAFHTSTKSAIKVATILHQHFHENHFEKETCYTSKKNEGMQQHIIQQKGSASRILTIN
ncbi:MAG: hypothetical protein R6U85_09780, partial [Salinivirgaceae bacterium]